MRTQRHGPVKQHAVLYDSLEKGWKDKLAVCVSQSSQRQRHAQGQLALDPPRAYPAQLLNMKVSHVHMNMEATVVIDRAAKAGEFVNDVREV